MESNKALLLAGFSLTALSAQPTIAWIDEKCYGVTRAGENDCANIAGTHGCHGQSSTNNAPEDFISLPRGLCAHIKGAKLYYNGAFIPAANSVQEAKSARVDPIPNREKCAGVAVSGAALFVPQEFCARLTNGKIVN